MRVAQPLLALDPDFIEQDMPAVAEELLVVQEVKPGRESRREDQFVVFAGGLVCATDGAWPLSGSPLRYAIDCAS